MAIPAYYSLSVYGSSGPDVALIQKWLNGVRSAWPSIGALTVDGKFGSKTLASVKTFQSLAGLVVDGKVGINTWNALYAKYASLHGAGEIYPGISLRNGMRGATVRQAQLQLSLKGYFLTADGIFGNKTEAAARSYQAAHGLTVDGIIGPATWAKLFV
jgi:peptidoglycan hydrolase-like protein with peptidoglycan-binding domain